MVDLNRVADESRASIEHADLKVLLPLLSQIEPKNILEIGTWKGGSAETWLKAFNPEIFVTYEKSPEPLIQEGKIEMPLDIRYYRRWFYFYGCDSHDLQRLEWLKENNFKFDYLFIDGDHSYQGVKNDFYMYSQFVKPGGIIAFHDALYYAKDTEEVIIFWQEIKQKYKAMEIKETLNSTGIGVLFV